jgi:3-mercaptopyruvate sulfurtransferase SseA
MSEIASKLLVETASLAERLDAPDLIVLDGSMHLPTTKRNAYAEYKAEHIPGAMFFDIDDISDEKSPLPHTLPPAANSRAACARWASATACGSSSTTRRASTRPPGYGGCSASWATPTWRC